MCPVCWAALVAQIVFYAAIGEMMVVLTDWKAGLPLTLGAAFAALGNIMGWWNIANEVLYVLVGIALVRGVWVIFTAERHWVRTLSLRFAGWARRLMRPLFPRVASH